MAKKQTAPVVERVSHVHLQALAGMLPSASTKPSELLAHELRERMIAQARAGLLSKKSSTGVSVKSVCCELLSEVVSTDDEGRTVGHSYAEVLRLARERLGSQVETSVNCLRWYATRIRNQDRAGYERYSLPAVRGK